MRVLPVNYVSPVVPAERLAPAVAWRQRWAWPAFRYSWLLLLGLMFGVLLPVVPHFFLAIQARPGPVLPDPLLAMAVRGRWRHGLALAAVLVGALVLVQRVHYTYDVLAAPLFTWLAYWAGGRIARLAAAPPDPAAQPQKRAD